MVLETHLGCSCNAIRNTISLSGLDSDERQTGFKCATNASLVSLIYLYVTHMILLGQTLG